MSKIKNINQLHADSLSWHEKIGLRITLVVGTMLTAFVFTVIALISLPAAIHTHDIIILVGWIAQTFLQLVLLPIIIVGQNVQSKHDQVKADEEFKLNQREEQQNEEIIKKLDTILGELHG